MANTEFKGTKGEWQLDQLELLVDADGDDEFIQCFSIIENENNFNIIMVPMDLVGRHEAQANAQLIATARELLEELQESNELLKRELNNVSRIIATGFKIQIKLNELTINKALGNE